MPERAQILDVNDRKAFRTIYEAINWCVGTNYTYWGRACWPNYRPVDGFRMWFTQLAYVENGKYVPATFDCINLICCNGNYHVFDKVNPQEPDVMSTQTWKYDLIFSKEKGGSYFFRGVFIADDEHSAMHHYVSKRIATKVKLIGCPARHLELLNSVDPGEFDVDYLKKHIVSSDVIDTGSSGLVPSTLKEEWRIIPNNKPIDGKDNAVCDTKITTDNSQINIGKRISKTVIKYDPSFKWNVEANYRPVFAVINRKIYRTNKWSELFQMLLFSYCFKKDRMERIYDDLKTEKSFYGGKSLIIKGGEESTRSPKFASDLYVRVFPLPSVDCEAISRILYYTGKNDLEIYLIQYDKNDNLDEVDELGTSFADNYKNEKGYKNGSTKHLIAHINGKVLNDKEKFFRRIEKEFDRTKLIGDISIDEIGEEYLKQYMHVALKSVAFGKGYISHPKVFAYGLVRVALKHYDTKTFWPYLNLEYKINIPINNQAAINEAFRKIMQQNNKPFDDTEKSYIQNMCMHAFVCDRYADQFFDYMFDFWRMDLSRSLENCTDESGNNIFDILIDEIGSGVQDIKLHTAMALKMNPVGCKNRFRRILRMIDNSYWNDTEYVSGSNRITTLFNKWKNNPQSSFAKEISKTASNRKRGRGEKLLSRPTIVYRPESDAFKILLPKQILRGCTEEENPCWIICAGDKQIKALPELLRGKAFLFTAEESIAIDKSLLFQEFEIKLSSERTNYYRRKIKADDVRFFNGKLRNIDSYDDYISKDVTFILTKKGSSLKYVNGSFSACDKSGDDFNFYTIEPTVGDILILPNNHALSIGQPLIEGIICEHKTDGVAAMLGDTEYMVTSHPEKLFFKASKQKLNGTSVKVFNASEQIYFGKAIDNNLLEFKLDDGLEDIYGYILDLKSLIRDNGVYTINLSIPGGSIRVYNICYINGFNYNYVGAPYLFKESGVIEFSKNMLFKTNTDWVIEGDKKTLEFNISEDERERNNYVKNRKLRLEYMFVNYSVDMIFNLPVLYWKFEADGEWYIQKPKDVMIKTMPKSIYITGDLNLPSSKVCVEDAWDLDEAEVSVNYDKDRGLFYFRTVDIVSCLNREKLYRNLLIKVNDKYEEFLRIVCRSDVRSQSLSGDFKRKKIFGYFDIFGDSEYMVTIKRGEKVIEEDIPLKKGKFEIDCDVEEGFYNVHLYEIEDDDSGFGSVSYKLGEYSLEVIDERNFNGKNLIIKYIRNKNKLLSDLQLSYQYVVVGLQRADYLKEIGEGLIYTWLYDSDDTKTMSSFEYYFGILGFLNKFDRFNPVSPVVVIIDNERNINEVLMNMDIDGFYEGLKYFPKRGSLIRYEDNLTKSGRRMIKMIDDDLYTIGVEIGGII